MNLTVFLPNWVGDAVMATPALRALRRHFAGARVVGVLRPYVAGVLEGGDWFDRLIPARHARPVVEAGDRPSPDGAHRSMPPRIGSSIAIDAMRSAM